MLGTETVTGGVLEKKVFIKIRQNSQETTCVSVQLRTTGGEGCHTSCVLRAHLHYLFSCFWQHVSLMVLFVKMSSYLHSNTICLSETVIFQ